jgi:hypothetical protein
MPFVEGYLDEKIIAGPGRPTHPIAPGGPVDPGWGVEGPVDPGYGVPLPPVTVWPSPPGGAHPSHPIQPTYPVDPGYGLPLPPTVWPQPPQPMPPVDPGYGVPIPISPEHPIYIPPGTPGNHPEHPIALPPGSVWPPLPPAMDGIYQVFVWIPGVGYRWTTIDTNLKPTHPIAPPPGQVWPSPGHPAHPIAPGGSPGTPTHPIDPGGQPTPTRR